MGTVVFALVGVMFDTSYQLIFKSHADSKIDFVNLGGILPFLTRLSLSMEGVP